MSDIEKRARELLADAYRNFDLPKHAAKVEAGLEFTAHYENVVIGALVSALTPPEGWVLVPVEPTEEMYAAATERVKENTVTWKDGTLVRDPIAHTWISMIDARPAPPNE